MAANRPIVLIGNWKMHKTIEEASSFVEGLLSGYTSEEQKIVGLAVPYTLLYPLSAQTAGEFLKIGAQNMNEAAEGAFTGEIAGRMLVDAGAQFVLLGHSERRHLYGEDDDCINRKVKRAVEAGLQPILCVGESKEQFERDETHRVLEQQLSQGLKGLDSDKIKNLIVAYEPVWAIGTQQSASSQIAQEAHHFCRSHLGTLFNKKIADMIPILYGGSVNSSNADELLAEPDIDGLLIGGASLSLDSFKQIVNHHYQKQTGYPT